MYNRKNHQSLKQARKETMTFRDEKLKISGFSSGKYNVVNIFFCDIIMIFFLLVINIKLIYHIKNNQ